MLSRLQQKEDSSPHLVLARSQLEQIATNELLPPDVRTGAEALAVKLEALLTVADQRRRAVEMVLGQVTDEYDEYDIRWIERRQRASDAPLQAVMEQRFALTAARALRKAAAGARTGSDYLSAAREVAGGQRHYLDLCPILAWALHDLSISSERAYAVERSERRLRALYRYWDDVAAAADRQAHSP